MNIAIVDIKSNTPKYDRELIDALVKQPGVNVTYFSPKPVEGYFFSCKVIPLFRFYKGPAPYANKYIKGLNILINYLYLLLLLKKGKFDVVHFQWFAFVSRSSIEYWFLKIIRRTRRIVFTVHNLYPHELDTDHSSDAAVSYRRRFIKMNEVIDAFITHTEDTRNNVNSEFSIPLSKIFVCVHGLFLPEVVANNVKVETGSFKIRMFGVQSPYKGTDLLIEAISKIPEVTRKKIDVSIIGFSDDYNGTDWPLRAKQLGIKWENRMLPEEELDIFLQNANLIIFPYRTVSQSGALLLALSYHKPLLASNIASFKETLSNMPDEVFFTSGDAEDLSNRIIDYATGKIDTRHIQKRIKELCDTMSWDVSAKQTLNVYRSVLGVS